MDFFAPLSCSSKGNNVIWIIVDHLNKIVYFSCYFMWGQSTEILVEKYMHEVVRLHDMTLQITHWSA